MVCCSRGAGGPGPGHGIAQRISRLTTELQELQLSCDLCQTSDKLSGLVSVVRVTSQLELAKYDQILTTIDYRSYNRGFLVLETRTNLPTSVSLSLKHILCHNKVMTFHRLGWDGMVDPIFVTIFFFLI